MGACVSHEVNGKNRIDVDGVRCIGCGACFDICEHKSAPNDTLTIRLTPAAFNPPNTFSSQNKGMIQYNLTFRNLIRYVREHRISGSLQSDEIEYGLGSVYPMPGGLKENVYWFLGEKTFA